MRKYDLNISKSSARKGCETMAKVLQNYFITLTVLLMMLLLSVGFIAQFQNGFVLVLSMTVTLTVINFAIESWLLRAALPPAKVHLIQSLVFPLSIVIMGIISFIVLPAVS